MAPRLSFNRLLEEFDERLQKGEIKAPSEQKYQKSSPIDNLKWMIKKKHEEVFDEVVKPKPTRMRKPRDGTEATGGNFSDNDKDLVHTEEELS